MDSLMERHITILKQLLKWYYIENGKIAKLTKNGRHTIWDENESETQWLISAYIYNPLIKSLKEREKHWTQK